MAIDKREPTHLAGSVSIDTEAGALRKRSAKEKLALALVAVIGFFAGCVGAILDPEVAPGLRQYSSTGYTTYVYTRKGVILPGLITGALALAIAVFFVDQIRLRRRAAETIGKTLKPEESISFGDWYGRVFGGSSWVSQGILWAFSGVIWIPIWYFVASGGAFGYWYNRRFGRVPFAIQIILWWFYGFAWIPLWYLIQRYTQGTRA